MLVLIYEQKSGKQVASTSVNLRGANYRPAEKEFFNEGWRCAVEDKLVDPARMEDYRFELRDENAS